MSEKKDKSSKPLNARSIDIITGLYNVDELNSTLDKIIKDILDSISDEKKIIYSFMMCDVNGLKIVNDSLGHNVGDDNLKSIGEIITNCIRTNDIKRQDNIFIKSLEDKILEELKENEIDKDKTILSMDRLKSLILICTNFLNSMSYAFEDLNLTGKSAFRIGGDEFLIILKNCTKENAERVKERINEKIHIKGEEDNMFQVSLAIGICDTTELIPINIEEIKKSEKERLKYFRRLKHIADTRMYENKKNTIGEQEKYRIVMSYLCRIFEVLGFDIKKEEDVLKFIDMIKGDIKIK